MKTLKYIMKTSAQKIFNVKFATFCAAFLMVHFSFLYVLIWNFIYFLCRNCLYSF